MATRTEVITYGSFTAPAGTVVASISVVFTDTAGNHVGQVLPPGGQPAPVTLADGSWTCEAQALDAAGNAIGPAVSDTFTVGTPAPVTVSIPTGLTGTTA